MQLHHLEIIHAFISLSLFVYLVRFLVCGKGVIRFYIFTVDLKKKKKIPRFQDIKTVLNMHKPAEGNSYCAVNLCTEASSCILVSVTNKHPIIVLFFLL